MQFFKMKSFEGDGLFHVLDMMIARRIYLSTRDQMNDINEGAWNFSCREDQHYQNVAKAARQIVDKQRFTCFIKSVNNPLMWAHYANGFSGIALEYNLDIKKYDLREITYKGKPTVSLSDLEALAEGRKKPQDINILKSKAGCWGYEGEWRLYGDSEYIYEKPVAIILGPNNSKHDSEIKDIADKFSIEIGYLNPDEDDRYEILYRKDYQARRAQ